MAGKNKTFWEDLWQRDMALLYDLRFWPLTFLRMFLGFTFAYHGALRLFSSQNLLGSISYFGQVGLPFPNVTVYLFGIIELAGGIFLLIGLFTRTAAFFTALMMLAVLFYAHIWNGVFVSNNGYEYALLIIGALAVIMVNGPGHLSFGNMMKGD